MKTPQQICADAAALIATPDKWVKNDFARTAAGLPVVPGDPRACKWCMVGAIERAVFNTGEYHVALADAARILALQAVIADNPTFRNLVTFNDCHTHPDVLNVLRKAAQ